MFPKSNNPVATRIARLWWCGLVPKDILTCLHGQNKIITFGRFVYTRPELLSTTLLHSTTRPNQTFDQNKKILVCLLYSVKVKILKNLKNSKNSLNSNLFKNSNVSETFRIFTCPAFNYLQYLTAHPSSSSPNDFLRYFQNFY